MDNMLKKVLIVEDDKDFLWLLRMNFENQGLLVSYALDGEEGFLMAQKENPDLLLMDITLPKMDGISMAKKIKDNGIMSKMIFLTNMNDPGHIQRALEISSNIDYIVKSDVHIDAIVQRVKQKLETI